MSIGQHSKNLTELLFRWESEIQERLGYVPENLQVVARQEIGSFLNGLETQLHREIAAVQQSRKTLGDSAISECAKSKGQ